MAVLDIARMGNPILRRRAAEVGDPMAPEIRRLVSDMLETMDYAGGTGLAAPQVHVPLRVVVFFVEAERARRSDQDDEPPVDDGGVPLTVLVNPVIEVTDPTPVAGLEACLSVPGLTGEVPRPRAIRYRGRDLGRPRDRPPGRRLPCPGRAA